MIFRSLVALIILPSLTQVTALMAADLHNESPASPALLHALHLYMDAKHRDEGIAELEALATAGDGAAGYMRGGLTIMLQKADYDDVLRWWIPAAEHGDAHARNQLAHAFLEGTAVPKDEAKGMAYLLSAVETGEMGVNLDYALMLIHGRLIPKDVPAGVALLTRLADHDQLSSQYELGEMYEKGTGIPTDPVKAFTYYQAAAKHLDAAYAYHALGRCYEDGIGTEKNLDLAITWYRKGANGMGGSSDAALKRLHVGLK